MWHQAINHVQSKSLSEMANYQESVVPWSFPAELPPKIPCSSCYSENLPREPHTRTEYSCKRGNTMLSDTCGQILTFGLNGERHSVSFLNSSTRFAAVITIDSRNEIPMLVDTTFNNFCRDFGWIPRILVSDNAPKYISEDVQNFLDQHDFKHAYVPTSIYSQDEYGPVERLNRKLKGAVTSALNTAELVNMYSPLTLQDAVYK